MTYLCADCSGPTDYYTARDELWATHGAGDGDLCLPCLSARVGRPLTIDDFSICGATVGHPAIRLLLLGILERYPEVPRQSPSRLGRGQWHESGRWLIDDR